MTHKLIVSGLALLLLAMFAAPAQSQSVEEFDSVSADENEPSSPDTSSKADLSKVTKMIIQQTNAFRRKNELRSLKVDDELTEAAQYFADFMARTKKYGHGADDQTPSQRANEYGYDHCIVLENIAYAFRSTGFEEQPLTEKFVEGWKNSEGHRENMLDPDIFETGVAVSRSEDKPQYFAVQMFGRPHSKAIQFRITNRAGEEVEYTVSRRNKEQSFKLPPLATRTHTQCRPSQLDLGWTEAKDKLSASDGRQFIVKKDGEKGLQIQTDTSEEAAKPEQ